MMRKGLFISTGVFCMSLLAGTGTMAVSLPPQESADSSQTQETDGQDNDRGSHSMLPPMQEEETEKKQVYTLPNPGNYFGEGSLDTAGYVYDGESYDIWYYPQDGNWGRQLNDWLNDCTENGFDWNIDQIEDNTTYTVSSGSLEAILIPNYPDRIMLMLQEGLELSEYVPYEEPDLELGDVNITLNGKTTHYKSAEFTLNLEGDAYNAAGGFMAGAKMFRISVPRLTGTGDIYRIEADKDNDYIKQIDLMYDYHSYASNGESKLFEKGSSDYFEMDILYADSDAIRGTMEGVFNGGEDELSVSFFLPKGELTAPNYSSTDPGRIW